MFEIELVILVILLIVWARIEKLINKIEIEQIKKELKNTKDDAE